MNRVLLTSALLGLAAAAPRPQDIDFDIVNAAPDPVFVTPAIATVAQTVTVAAESAVSSSAAAAISTAPAVASKRGIQRRDGTCANQAKGSGPVASPDTVDGFFGLTALQAASSSAYTPNGYSQVFAGLNASLSASNYMGLTVLTSYDTLTCASKCDQASGCVAFNVYAERDPTKDPNANSCPNPASTTNYVCTLWGVPVAQAEATNTGQWRDSFQVVITASNAYNKAAPPDPVDGFLGPVELGGAINAPLDAQGHNTFMGSKYYPFSQSQGYTPSTCASACNAQTAYNKAHPNKDGSYQTCVFFNAYVLSNDSIPLGLYCSLYNETWAASYGTNYGQYRGSDRFTVSQSYSYSLETLQLAESIIVTSSLQPFCSTLLGYTTPLTTVTVTSTVAASATQVVDVVANTTAIFTPTTTVTTTAPATVFGFYSTSTPVAGKVKRGVYTFTDTKFHPTDAAKLKRGVYTFTDTKYHPTDAVEKRSVAVATPSALTAFAPSVISAACSVEATPVSSTSTITVYTSVTSTSTSFTTTTTGTSTSTSTAPTATATYSTETFCEGLTGYDDGDYILTDDGLSTLKECMDLCRNTTGCKSFAYEHNQWCELSAKAAVDFIVEPHTYGQLPWGYYDLDVCPQGSYGMGDPVPN